MALSPPPYSKSIPTILVQHAPPTPPRRPSGARPLPSPPATSLKHITVSQPPARQEAKPDRLQDEDQVIVSRPKRVSYINTWMSSIEPGSPATPSPLSADPLAPPPLSPDTQDIARRLLDFAGLPSAQSPIPLARIMPRLAMSALAPPSRAPTKSPIGLLSPASAITATSALSTSSSAVLRQYRVGFAQQAKRGVATAHRRSSARRRSQRRSTIRRNRVSRTLQVVPEGANANARATREQKREVFLDDDEWEFAPLVILNQDGTPDDDWEDFDDRPLTATSESMYSHQSDLAPEYELPNPHDIRSPTRATPPNSGSAPPPPPLLNSGSSGTASGPPLLTIPARSQRRAAHLRKPSYVLSTDLVFPASPIKLVPTQPSTQPSRRRPTPLDIPSPTPSRRFSGATMCASSRIVSATLSSPQKITVSPVDIRRIREAFIAQSFRPVRASRGADIGAVPSKVVVSQLSPDAIVPTRSNWSPSSSLAPPRGKQNSTERGGRRGRGRSSKMGGLQSGVRSVWSVMSLGISSRNSSRNSTTTKRWL